MTSDADALDAIIARLTAGTRAGPTAPVAMKIESSKADFWTRRVGWPRAVGHVFLAEAVMQIGRALYGDLWRDIDPLFVSNQRRPPRPIPHTGFEDYNKLQVFNYDTETGRIRYETESRERAIVGNVLTDEERGAGAVRANAVKQMIATLAVNGELRTATRPIAGGACRPLEPVLWQTEYFLGRFERCQLDPSAPFAGGVAGDRYEYIFVEEHSLVATLRQIAIARHGGEDNSVPFTTGVPSRPNVIERFILPEMQKRVADMTAGSRPIPATKIEFATQLCDWLPDAFPHIEREKLVLKPKSVRDCLAFKTLWSEQIAPLKRAPPNQKEPRSGRS